MKTFPNQLHFDGEKIVMKDGSDVNEYLKNRFDRAYDINILNTEYANYLLFLSSLVGIA